MLSQVSQVDLRGKTIVDCLFPPRMPSLYVYSHFLLSDFLTSHPYHDIQASIAELPDVISTYLIN